MTSLRSRIVLIAVLIVAASWQLTSSAQRPEKKPVEKPAAAGTRFEFEVIESFDAKYQGDTPGHMGRSGGLVGIRPRVSLSDPVFRGKDKEQVGTITSVMWSRAQESLTLEFDPKSGVRIAVGDTVWIDLNPTEEGAVNR